MMTTENDETLKDSEAQDFTIPDKIRFNYLKSNLYRVIKTSGAIGRATSTGEIAVHIYSDRSPIPKWIEHAVDSKTGELGEVVDSESIHDLVREVEATLMMSVSQAESLAKWLNEKAAQSRKIMEEVTERKSE